MTTEDMDVREESIENPVEGMQATADADEVYEGDYPAESDTGKPWWWDLWQGMPEFVQYKLDAWRTVKVHFRDIDDLEAFGRLVDQNLSPSTKAIWFPRVQELKQLSEMRFVSDDDERPPDETMLANAEKFKPKATTKAAKKKREEKKADGALTELFKGLK